MEPEGEHESVVLGVLWMMPMCMCLLCARFDNHHNHCNAFLISDVRRLRQKEAQGLQPDPDVAAGSLLLRHDVVLLVS